MKETGKKDLQHRLDGIEARLQAMVEGGINLILPVGNPQQALARRLRDAIQANLVISPDGFTLTAPNIYNVHVPPSHLEFWQNHQPFVDKMADELYQAGSDAGFQFLSRPHLNLIPDQDVLQNDLKVVSESTQTRLDKTSAHIVDLGASSSKTLDAFPISAFLIVNGSHHFPLQQTVINIGRRLDNHLVIDDPRVSRNHVQLRAVKGHYILFDLNSTGGTCVNGLRVNQCLLNPGDVISLAGFPLIYGQEDEVNLPDTGSLPNQPSNKINLDDISPRG